MVVEGSAYKRMRAHGKFVSQHKEEDIKRWLEFKSTDTSEEEYGKVFSIEDYAWEDNGVDEFFLDFREVNEDSWEFEFGCEQHDVVNTLSQTKKIRCPFL